MQFKLSLITLALATLAAATPARRNTPEGGCSANTGSLQCCTSVGEATDSVISGILATIGINAQDVTGLVGVTCTSIVDVAGSNSCSTQAACCTDDSFHGLVALGCTPINLGA